METRYIRWDLGRTYTVVAGAMTHKAIHRTRRKAHSDAARVNRVPTWAVQNEIRA